MMVEGPDPARFPSPWVVQFASYVPAGGPVLDVACGGGRHTRFFLGRGHTVVAVDRDVTGVADLQGEPRVEIVECDLEGDGPRSWPFGRSRFAGVVVTNYLYRPSVPDVVAAVAPGGVLIYETFAAGHERFGRPRSPDFLLRPGELLDAVRGALRVVAYEDVVIDEPRPAAVQRIAAVRERSSSG